MDTKQAEKDYLSRSGSRGWELEKPFTPHSQDMQGHGADVLHDFTVAMQMLRPSPSDLILDLGAGGCWCSDLLGRFNLSAIAVDISHEMLRVGRSRPGTAIRAAAGDMEALPFRSGVFTKCICLSAMHHVPDIALAVKEVARVLRGGGMAFFSEPGRGHADASVSTTAMREYGVLEQEILVTDFMEKCRAGGFRDVRVKPLAYAVPGYDLTLEEWQSWSRLAASTRPRRALAKIGLGLAEVFGLGKRGRLFEDSFGVSLVRTLRQLIDNHPIVVASK